MYRIVTVLCVSLLTTHPIFAQQQGELNYPDLIPVLQNGLYGFCDEDMNVKINPIFKWVTLFSKDPDFLDIKDPKKKEYGSSDYATVWLDDQKMRIDKEGNVVYQYHAEDFYEIRPKESSFQPVKVPFEKFQDEKTKLWGVRNEATGEILIPAIYSVIQEEFYSSGHSPKYPLVLAYQATGNYQFFVGLNGTEYIIHVIQSYFPDEEN